MRVTRRRLEQVVERAGVVAEHVAVADAQAAALDDDDAARLERLDGGIDRLRLRWSRRGSRRTAAAYR